MLLNQIKPAANSKHAAKRVGRGMGSGLGKTCGRGHKGQHSRTGGYRKVGFEGGQMPLKQRLPKFGFTSSLAKHRAQVRLHELAKIDADVITIDSLIDANVVPVHTKKVKVIMSGELNKPVKLQGISVTKGAQSVIEANGGKVES